LANGITVPEGWFYQELSKYGDFIKGKGGPKKDSVEDGLPCIRYGQLYTTYKQFILDFKSFIDPQHANNYTALKQGDVLFAGSGETHEEIGMAAVYMLHEEAYAGGDIIIFRPSGKLDISYLGYAVNSYDACKQKAQLGQGSSVIHIYTDHLRKLRVPIPPVPEQKKIAEILGSVDVQIQTEEIKMKELNQVKRGLMQNLLTGKVRVTI